MHKFTPTVDQEKANMKSSFILEIKKQISFSSEAQELSGKIVDMVREDQSNTSTSSPKNSVCALLFSFGATKPRDCFFKLHFEKSVKTESMSVRNNLILTSQAAFGWS